MFGDLGMVSEDGDALYVMAVDDLYDYLADKISAPPSNINDTLLTR